MEVKGLQTENAKDFKAPLLGSSPGPSPTDNCVGKVEMSKMNKIRPSVIYRVTRESLYYAIVTAKKEKKKILRPKGSTCLHFSKPIFIDGGWGARK